MGNLRNRLTYGAIGVASGMAGLANSAGPCTGNACSACLRCAGFGVVLVALALWQKRKETENGLVENSN